MPRAPIEFNPPGQSQISLVLLVESLYVARHPEVLVVDATRCHWLVLQKGSVGRFVIRLFLRKPKRLYDSTNPT